MLRHRADRFFDAGERFLTAKTCEVYMWIILGICLVFTLGLARGAVFVAMRALGEVGGL